MLGFFRLVFFGGGGGRGGGGGHFDHPFIFQEEPIRFKVKVKNLLTSSFIY